MRNKKAAGARKILLYSLIALTGLICAAAAAFFICPGFWYGMLADIMLGSEQIGEPEYNPLAAMAAADKIEDLKAYLRGGTRPANEITISALEINSRLTEVHQKTRDKLSVLIPDDPNGQSRRLTEALEVSESLDNLQVTLQEGHLTLWGNVDLAKLAPSIQRRTGGNLPREFQRRVIFRAGFSVGSEDGVLSIVSDELKIGTTSLKGTIITPALADIHNQIESLVEAKIAAQFPESFERLPGDGMRFRLPDGVRDISITDEHVKFKLNRRR